MTPLAAPAFALLLGGLAGWAAQALGLPLPWMLGPLLALAIWVQARPRGAEQMQPPRWLVTAMICVIGLMIGGTFTPELAARVLGWWVSVLGVAVFVIVSQFGAYQIYLRLFHYDRATAFFAASPGGFIENIALGVEAGGDRLSLTLLQFLRLVSILFLLPLGFSIWTGHPVGSAAGESLGGAAQASLRDYALMALAAGGGYGAGLLLRLPTPMIIGPLLAAAGLHLSGLLVTQPHPLAMIVAQVVLGVSLGTRFAGLKRHDLCQAARACSVVVVWFAFMTLLCAEALALISDQSLPVYIMSLAPAGVIEMSLVALSLGTNPVFVTTHHVIRILVTVLILPMIFHRWIKRR